MRTHAVQILAVTSASFCLGMLSGCTPATPSARPSVLIVSFDALRSDAISPYGAPTEVTPHMAAFAREATVFETAYSATAKTPSSFAAALTGHHATDALVDWALPADIPTLAERFKEEGWATAAFFNNPALQASRGFDRGFDRFEMMQGIDDERVVALALEWLSIATEPFLLWVHLIDPHAPWMPHREAIALYEDGASTLRAGAMPALLVIENEAELKRARDLYRGEVHRSDRLFGVLLAKLESLGVAGSTVVVLTSDHGEEMMEHGRLQHGALTEENLAIPAIVRAPGQTAGDVRSLFRGVDLLPTLASLVGVEAPVDVDGVDALSVTPGSVVAVAHTNRKRQAASIRVGDHKLIVECLRGAPHGRALYDLVSDPDEHVDRAEIDAPRADALEARLWSELRRSGCAELPMRRGVAPTVVPDDRAALEALGYLGAEAGGEDD